MKTVINVVLTICVAALLYICYGSIMEPIHFQKEKAAREKAVIAQLIDIRNAQMEYRSAHNGKFTACFDSLIAFVKTAKRPYIIKKGILTDDQLDKGLTEEKAVQIIEKAKETGNWQKVKEAGLNDFRRDTLWVTIKDTLFGKGFNADSLPFIPYGKGARFELETRTDSTYSDMPLYLFQAQAAFDTFLNDLNRQQLNALKATCEKENKYAGLRVGDIEQPNNNAGNWE